MALNYWWHPPDAARAGARAFPYSSSFWEDDWAARTAANCIGATHAEEGGGAGAEGARGEAARASSSPPSSPFLRASEDPPLRRRFFYWPSIRRRHRMMGSQF